MQLLKLEETECRPHRDNHRLMWHSSITTATRAKTLSSRKSSIREKKQKKTAVCCTDTQIFHRKCFVHVLRCRGSVMACSTQMDFYEASQLHLFHCAVIKPAETIVSGATSGRRAEFSAAWLIITPRPRSRRSEICFIYTEKRAMNRGQAPRMGRKIRGVEKISMCFLRRHTHSLALQVSDCGWYICAWCVS